jgi:tetratricopeptide (TPR) repeat protein
VPASITADQLDPEARAELRTLPGDLAEAVARQLIAASLAEDPEQAYRHAQAARQLAARVGVVRESVGIAAYRAGHWAEALAELRAARRLTGRSTYLPMMADSERALGRLDRALDLATGPQAVEADRATRIELKIVESGIRRDQGLPGAAVVALQIPELTDGRQRRGSARLYYAYADALLDAGREDEAREWFARAAGADTQGETDADERFDELDQLAIEDLQAGDEDSGLEDYDDDLDADDDLDGENVDDEGFDDEDVDDEDLHAEDEDVDAEDVDAEDLDTEDLDADDLDGEDLDDEDTDASDFDDEDAGGDEDRDARPGAADSTRDEPSPFEIHYLPPSDPAADDGDPGTAAAPGPDSPGAGDAAYGDDGER